MTGKNTTKATVISIFNWEILVKLILSLSIDGFLLIQRESRVSFDNSAELMPARKISHKVKLQKTYSRLRRLHSLTATLEATQQVNYFKTKHKNRVMTRALIKSSELYQAFKFQF